MSNPEVTTDEYITPELAAELSNSGVAPDCYEARYVNLKTEAMDSFKGQYVKPVRAQKKKYIHQYRAFDARTTNQDDFGYKGMPERRKPIILGDNGLGDASAPFNGDTTNKSDFRLWNSSQPPAAIRPVQNALEGDDDRTFETENARAFTGASYPPRKSRGPQAVKTETLPFAAITTNQSDFQKWNARPATLVDRSSKYRPRSDDRSWLTEAKAEYIKKPFDSKQNVDTKEYDPCAPGTNLYNFGQ